VKKYRFFCLLLVLITALLSLSACGTGGNTEVTTGPNETKEPSTVIGEETYRFKSANYKNKDLGILNMTDLDDFYTAKDDHSAPVDDAVFKRNLAVEEKYNVNIVYYPMEGKNKGKAAFNAEIRSNEASGLGTYGLYMGQTFYTNSLIVEGMYYDILKAKHLNLDAPWWDGSVNDTLEINGKLYCSIGSFNAGQLTSMMGVYYNKTLYENYNLGAFVADKSIYDVVRDGEWTFEVMSAMTKTFSNHETIMGLGYDLHGIYCSIAGSGVTMVEEDESGNLSILGLYNDHFVSYYEDYYEFFVEEPATLYYTDIPAMRQRFSEDKMLFMVEVINTMGSGHLLNSETVYGILPFPMYTTDQGEYRTNVEVNEIIQVSPTSNTEMVCVLLEYLHYQSRHVLFPVYFEEKLQYRLTDHPDDAEMLQLIRDSLHYDFGTLFTTEINYVWEGIMNSVRDHNPNIASWWAGLDNGNVPQGLLDELLFAYNSMS